MDQTVLFPVWIFIPATYTYVGFASAPYPQRCQLPGSFTEQEAVEALLIICILKLQKEIVG